MHTSSTSRIRVGRESGDPRVIVRTLDDVRTTSGGNQYVLFKGGDLFELDHVVVEVDHDPDLPADRAVCVRIAGRKVRKSDYARFDRVSYLVSIEQPFETVVVLPGETA